MKPAQSRQGSTLPDKQFHFQSSTESEIASRRPAAVYRRWTQRFRDKPSPLNGE